MCAHARSQIALSEGPGVQLWRVCFQFDDGRKDPNTTISGPSSARQRNAISMLFRWRVDDGPTMNAGLVAL